MARFLVLPAAAAAVVLATCPWADGQVRVLAQGEPVVVTSQGGVAAPFPAMPGYYMLSQKHVRDELELTEEQIEALKELGKKYVEGMRYDWQGLQNLSQEERQAKMAEYRRKQQKLMEEIRGQVEELLLPHQIDALKKITFRQRAPWTLQNPRMLEELKVSEEQKAQLQEIRDRMQEQLRKVQQDALDKALEVLTDEQRKKLEELSTSGWRYGGRSRQ
jgi:Spy/CpxP family protein refolding chaperone